MFRKNRKFDLNSLPSSQMRVLTEAEIALVSGGDDGSCSAGGDCSSSSASDSGAVGTLGEVTVNANQGTLSDNDATNLVNSIDTAMTSPGISVIYFAWTAFNWINLMQPTPPLGNPMGDPSPSAP